MRGCYMTMFDLTKDIFDMCHTVEVGLKQVYIF